MLERRVSLEEKKNFFSLGINDKSHFQTPSSPLLSSLLPSSLPPSLPLERPYDLFAPIAFTNSGMRPYTSPANEVLMDFIARGITVDQLYSMLEEMGAVGAMETLEGYGQARVTIAMTFKLTHPMCHCSDPFCGDKS